MPRINLEEIQARIDKNLPPHSASSETARKPTVDSLPPNHPLWELWTRLSEMYGHTWSSQQGDKPNDTWLRGLQDLTPAQYGAGLRACLARTSPFPPTLPEFRQLCTGYDPQHWERRIHKPFREERSALEDLTGKELALAERKAALARLRQECGI